jgi:hypothetical protein
MRQRLMDTRLRGPIVIHLRTNMRRRCSLTHRGNRRSSLSQNQRRSQCRQQRNKNFQLHTGNLSATSIGRAEPQAGFKILNPEFRSATACSADYGWNGMRKVSGLSRKVSPQFPTSEAPSALVEVVISDLCPHPSSAPARRTHTGPRSPPAACSKACRRRALLLSQRESK